MISLEKTLSITHNENNKVTEKNGGKRVSDSQKNYNAKIEKKMTECN